MERYCGGVFLDPTGKDTHRSTERYVPLGETTSQGGDGSGALTGHVLGVMSERYMSACVLAF